MELSKITTVVRPRTAWQAIDLGVRMASVWFKPLWLAWITVTLPLFIIIELFFYAHSVWGIMLLWWLKPLFERIILAYLSHSLFAEHLNLKALLKHYRQVVFRQLLPTLFWRRLSPYRSYLAPIVQLENLYYYQRTDRIERFAGHNQHAALWLMIVCLHIEIFISIAIYALAYLLIPQQDAALHDNFFSAVLSEDNLFANMIGYLSISLVAPFYVASGFSLYLNQRTVVEGWDIEIAFRQLAARQRTATTTTATIRPLLSGMIIALLLCLPAEPVLAQPVADTTEQVVAAAKTPERINTEQLTAEILNSPIFNEKHTEKWPTWLLTQSTNDQDEKPQQSWPFLEMLVAFLSNSIELMLTGVVCGFFILLIYRYRHSLRQLLSFNQGSITVTQKPPENLFGLAIDANSLPSDPAGQAMTLWQAGKTREALSLLYRGCLYQLINNDHIVIYDGFTEGECVKQAKAKAEITFANYFAQVTQQWQKLAYAQVTPKDAEMRDLLANYPATLLKPRHDEVTP